MEDACLQLQLQEVIIFARNKMKLSRDINLDSFLCLGADYFLITLRPIAQTPCICRSGESITISASFPTSREPFRSYIPIIRAGVSDAMRTASARGISAFSTIVRMSLSIVAILPAKAERSESLQTPSSMMVRGS